MNLIPAHQFMKSEWILLGNRHITLNPDRGFNKGRVWQSRENDTEYCVNPLHDRVLNTLIPSQAELLESLPCLEMNLEEIWRFDIDNVVSWKTIYVVHVDHYLTGKLVHHDGMAGMFCIQGPDYYEDVLKDEFPVGRLVEP